MIQLSDYGYKGNTQLDAGIPARVTSVHRQRYEVISERGEAFARCKASAFRGDANQYPTVGDYVALLPNDSGDSTILCTLPRTSTFSRSNYLGHAVGYAKTVHEQMVAANFDYVFIVQSLNHNYNLKRLVRYLTMAHATHSQPVVILTKSDLVQSPDEYIQQAKSVCGDAPVHAISSVTGDGMGQLAPYLAPGTTLVLLGSSGVGKSSLLNHLAGEELMPVNIVREQDSRGRHTTTRRQLVRLASGVIIIDTPGMRELGMWDAQEGLLETFADIGQLAAQCRFADCTHTNEPKCAVQTAIQNGDLSPKRFKEYKALKDEAVSVSRKSRKIPHK